MRIEREQYNLLKAYFSELALRRSAPTLERMIATLPFEPYAAVYRQLWGLVRAVNEIRKAAGYDPIAPELRKMASAGETVRVDKIWPCRGNHGTTQGMKAYLGIADSDGLLSFVPEGVVPDGLMVLDARAARGRGWACFWAAVDEETARQVGEELASGRRRDAMNLLWVLAREIVRYPAGASHETDFCPVLSSEFASCGPRSRSHEAAGFDIG